MKNAVCRFGIPHFSIVVVLLIFGIFSTQFIQCNTEGSCNTVQIPDCDIFKFDVVVFVVGNFLIVYAGKSG